MEKILIPSQRFEKYYDLVIYKYLIYGLGAYGLTSVASVLLSRYIHWIIGLVISLVITTYEFFSVRAMRKEIPEGSIMHSILNLIPGMKYVHMYSINEFKKSKS